jgi:hypothetical protein
VEVLPSKPWDRGLQRAVSRTAVAAAAAVKPNTVATAGGQKRRVVENSKTRKSRGAKVALPVLKKMILGTFIEGQTSAVRDTGARSMRRTIGTYLIKSRRNDGVAVT